MSKKKESIKYEQVERTPDNPLGRVGNLEWITVTPEGAGIGAPSDDMIPQGAKLSDAERRKIEATRGARYFNAAMGRGSRPFVDAANLLGWAFAPGPMAFATGVTGLYNTFQELMIQLIMQTRYGTIRTRQLVIQQKPRIS